MEEFKKTSTPPSILIIYSLIIFILVNLLLAVVAIYNFKERVTTETAINIHEYEEVDLSHICQIADCSFIKNNDVLYKNVNFNIKKYAKLEVVPDNIYKQLIILPGVYLTMNSSFLIEIELQRLFNGFVVVTGSTVFALNNNIYFKLLTFIITGNLIFVLIFLFNRKKIQLRDNKMLQHEGYYNSMMLLTENIHHELNTPLAIINNKVKQLQKRSLEQYSLRICSESKIKETDRDFNLISASLTQINDLLDRMRPFKDVKTQNERDLKTVITTSCDLMGISQNERFDFKVYSGFENFKLDGKYLKNGELTAILLNFIKNSLDANATNLEFKIKSYDEKQKMLSFFVIDNGNGISEEFKKDIFKDKSSTKSGTRGAGLYINKFILNSANGDIILSHSSDRGTIFVIRMPVIKLGE